MRRLILFSFLFLFCIKSAQSQTEEILEECKELSTLAYDRIFSNLDSALYYALKANKKLASLTEEGQNSEYNAILSKTNSVLGYIYGVKGNYYMATEIFYQSLEQSRRIQNTSGEVAALINLASVSNIQEDSIKALNFYKTAVNISMADGSARDKASASFAYGTFLKEYNRDSAMYYLSFAEEHFIESQDSAGLCRAVHKMAQVYFENSSLDSAKNLAFRARDIAEAIQDLETLAITYVLLTEIELKERSYEEATIYAEKARQTAKKINTEQVSKKTHKVNYQLYKQTKEWKKALEFHEKFLASTLKEIEQQSNKEAIRLHYAVEFERKSVADSLKFEEERIIQQAEKERQQLLNQKKTQQLIFLGIFLVVILFFTIVLYRRLKVSNSQKRVINIQKAKVEKQHLQLTEKNQEILDSITYAKRIQSAILPSEETIQKYLKRFFIFYRPKDIVAGDFYWFEENEDQMFLAAADCTGHGVPGAMVSVVCANALNKAVNEKGLSKPGELLNETRALIVDTFAKAGKNVKDGMDISLIAIDKKTLNDTSDSKSIQITFSGAYNPLWIISGNDEIEEIKGNKQPVGLYENSQPFETHHTTLEKGDQLYMFSDGYADQFGGPKGKKFKSKNLKQLFLKISVLSVNEQLHELEQHFDNWKGDLEQLDDVCVIGVKI